MKKPLYTLPTKHCPFKSISISKMPGLWWNKTFPKWINWLFLTNPLFEEQLIIHCSWTFCLTIYFLSSAVHIIPLFWKKNILFYKEPVCSCWRFFLWSYFLLQKYIQPLKRAVAFLSNPILVSTLWKCFHPLNAVKHTGRSRIRPKHVAYEQTIKKRKNHKLQSKKTIEITKKYFLAKVFSQLGMSQHFLANTVLKN